MMPEKLYIPTTTLNFNNIMSSESISPAGFYSKRGFGYKRFYKIVPNNLDNRIILYENYPDFEIHDDEQEHYPMVIEVDTKYIGENIIKRMDDIFFAEETLYLNPFTTQIFFRDYKEKSRTLSAAAQSIETKMVSLYKDCLSVRPNDIISKVFLNEEFEDSTNDISKYISKDIRTNKLKGFMYAYLLAANKKFSDEVVLLRKHAKELRNILSAIITSPDGQASYQQSKQLDSLYKSINNTFYKAEGLQEKLDLRIQQKAEEYNCPGLYNFLEREKGGLKWFTEQQNLALPNKLEPYNNYGYSQSTSETFKSYFRNLEQRISKIELKQHPTKMGVVNLPVLQNGKVIQILDQKDFLSRLFNRYLEEGYDSEEFMQSRYEFAKAGGLIFKDEVNEVWQGSESQRYVNALLVNLNEHTAFDINGVANLTLKSFAAFCQKGDHDINKLQDYLISSGIGDFRISLSLWGAIFGFANIPKTLTNELFDSEDLVYVSTVYKYIYKQVHGIQLEGDFETDLAKMIPPLSSGYNRRVEEEYTPDQLRKQLSVFPEFLSMNDKIQLEVTAKFYEKGIYLPDVWNPEAANDIDWPSPRKSQKKLIAAISNSRKIKKDSQKKTEETQAIIPFLEQNINKVHIPPTVPRQKEFYKDQSAWDLLKKSIPINEEVKGHIDWIQRHYQDMKYAPKTHSNKAVITHFYNYGKQVQQRKGIPRIELNLLQTIVAKLRELYP